MSRIFVLVGAATLLFTGAAAFGAAVDNSGANDDLMQEIAAIFGTGLELGAIIPIVLIVGLLIGVLGILAR